MVFTLNLWPQLCVLDAAGIIAACNAGFTVVSSVALILGTAYGYMRAIQKPLEVRGQGACHWGKALCPCLAWRRSADGTWGMQGGPGPAAVPSHRLLLAKLEGLLAVSAAVRGSCAQGCFGAGFACRWAGARGHPALPLLHCPDLGAHLCLQEKIDKVEASICRVEGKLDNLILALIPRGAATKST